MSYSFQPEPVVMDLTLVTNTATPEVTEVRMGATLLLLGTITAEGRSPKGYWARAANSDSSTWVDTIAAGAKQVTRQALAIMAVSAATALREQEEAA